MVATLGIYNIIFFISGIIGGDIRIISPRKEKTGREPKKSEGKTERRRKGDGIRNQEDGKCYFRIQKTRIFRSTEAGKETEGGTENKGETLKY